MHYAATQQPRSEHTGTTPAVPQCPDTYHTDTPRKSQENCPSEPTRARSSVLQPYLHAQGAVACHPRSLTLRSTQLMQSKLTGEPPLRGRVTRFTAKSRLHMIQMIASIRLNELSSCMWISLTYHLEVPADRETIIAHQRAWFERVRRMHPTIQYVRRIDWQERGAVHWHLLAWTAPGDQHWNTFHDRMRIKAAWHAIAEPASLDHELYGAKCVVADSYKAILQYVSQDAAKVGARDHPDYHGRRWSNSYGLPRKPVRIGLTEFQAYRRLRRACKLLGRLRGASQAWLYQADREHATLTILTGEGEAERLLHIAGIDLPEADARAPV